MLRRTLGELRQLVPRWIPGGLCAGDPEVVSILNQAQERLLNAGKWAGTLARYRFCVHDGCITMPREVASVLRWAVDDVPGHIENMWYEFLFAGPGVQDGNSGNGGTLIPRGQVSVFRGLCGAKNLRVYTDLTESVTAKILFKGMDENGNRVQSYDVSLGQYIDGEYVSLYGGPNQTTNRFTSIDPTGVIKPVTNGYVRVYAVGEDNKQSLIAVYAPGETLPCYRYYQVPGLTGPSVITALVKRQHINVVSDNDDMIITNLYALQMMCKAIEYYRRDDFDNGRLAEMKALEELERETMEYNGGEQMRVNVNMRNYGGGQVVPMI